MQRFPFCWQERDKWVRAVKCSNKLGESLQTQSRDKRCEMSEKVLRRWGCVWGIVVNEKLLHPVWFSGYWMQNRFDPAVFRGSLPGVVSSDVPSSQRATAAPFNSPPERTKGPLVRKALRWWLKNVTNKALIRIFHLHNITSAHKSLKIKHHTSFPLGLIVSNVDHEVQIKSFLPLFIIQCDYYRPLLNK